MFIKRLAADFKESIGKDRPLIKADSVLIFTCGAAKNPISPTGRDLVLKYADTRLKGVRFFDAESFFEVFENSMGKDLLSIEESLAAYSDCIVLIPESAGSLAELGAFSISQSLCRILLVINDKKFKDSDTFISKGPIAKIDKISKFKPVVWADFSHILSSMGEIENRLDKILRMRGRYVDLLNSYDIGSNNKYQLMWVHDVMHHFSPIRKSEIFEIFKIIYGGELFDIDTQMSLLKSIGLVRESEGFWYTLNKSDLTFYELPKSKIDKFRSRVISAYSKSDRSRMLILKHRLI